MKLDRYIDMLKQFDYKKNGKSLTIEFLAQMIQYFNYLDEGDFK